MTELPRWVFAAVLILLVIGLVAVARGEDHHRGEQVGAADPVGARLRLRPVNVWIAGSFRSGRGRIPGLAWTSRAVDARCRPARCGADPAAGDDDLAVRHRRHQRTAPGGAPAERGLRKPDGVQERLHRRGRRRCGGGRCHVRRGCDLHPAGRRCADRYLEHGRDHSHDRRLRHQAGQPLVVLPDRRRRLCPCRHGHRQLLDNRGHPGCGIRRDGQRDGSQGSHRRRRRHLRRLLRRQDDPALRDDDPRPQAGRRVD